jgi:lipase chaperone LimK
MTIIKKARFAINHPAIVFILAVLAVPVFLWEAWQTEPSHHTTAEVQSSKKNTATIKVDVNYVQHIVASVERKKYPAEANDIFYPDQTSSLEGTQIDGGLTTDTQGRFVPDQHALHLFDYFFLASGEIPDATIEATIRQYIFRRLTNQAQEEALDFLNQYITYRLAAKELYLSAGDKNELAERYALIKTLRAAVFGESLSERLFSDQEKVASLSLQRLAVLSNKNLTSQKKSEQVDRIKADLPQLERDAYRRSLAPSDLRKKVNQLRKKQADSSQVWLAREQIFGPEAADRLAQLDESKQQWQNRVDQYRAQRKKILDSQTQDAEAAARQISKLQTLLFSTSELKRIRTLDSIAEANIQ